MIIVRSPLRITLGGGGTDLPSYYEGHTGFLMAAAIDRYVYITIHDTFEPAFIIKYSRLERVRTVREIEHPIVREALLMTGFEEAPGLEIASMADIPAGSGLGSSGSFTTALLKGLYVHKRNPIQPSALAEAACEIEMGRLQEPVGKQDPYAAACGGITCFRFGPGGKVDAWPLAVSEETRYDLEDNLLLFFTGYSRSASAILRDQDERSRAIDPEMLRNLDSVKELAFLTQDALESGDTTEFARLMDVHWQKKRARSPGMSNGCIDAMYDFAMENGALGGKLIGAGGGGFLMFYASDRARLRRAMSERGLREVRFRFDFEGTKVLVP